MAPMRQRRAMTAAERAALQRAGTGFSVGDTASILISGAGAGGCVFVLVLALFGLVVGLVFPEGAAGWHPLVRALPLVIGGLGLLLAVGYALSVALAARRAGAAERARIAEDLAAGEVDAEAWHFDAAFGFRDPEHGLSIWCLRDADGDILAMHGPDPLSEPDAAEDGEAAAAAPRQPWSRLALVRAPRSRLILAEDWDGRPLEIGEPVELSAPPERWPLHGEAVPGPWEALVARLALPGLK